MPVITIRYKKGLLTEAQIEEITPKFQDVLAKRLSCDEVQFGRDWVDTDWYERPANYNGIHDVLIFVLGQDYPSRMANLEERVNLISGDLADVFPKGMKCCVGCFMPGHHGAFFEGKV